MMTILALIVTLGILVTVHEYGHFWVARRCGVKVLRFSVGFGKPLFRWYDKQGTEFVIAMLPLGGYVKMLDAREGDVSEADAGYEFTSKPVAQRVAIVSAGPLANFLFAVVAYWILLMVGVTGVSPYVSGVLPGSLVEEAGFAAPTVIAQVDGKQVSTWQEARMALIERAGDSGVIVLTDADRRQYSIAVSGWLSGTDIDDPVALLGLMPLGTYLDATIDTVQVGSAAERGGIAVGDHIVAVDDQAVSGWDALVERVQASPGKPLVLDIDRDGWLLQLTVTPDRQDSGVGYLGVSPLLPELPEDFFVTLQYGPLTSLWKALNKTWDTVGMSFSMFGKMLSGAISTQNIGGPVAIAKMAGQSAASGPEVFLGFLAFISISLGVVNLLPIPVLDGGHLLYYVIEWIWGKPLPEHVQAFGFRIGSSLLVVIMVFAIVNDIVRLF